MTTKRGSWLHAATKARETYCVERSEIVRKPRGHREYEQHAEGAKARGKEVEESKEEISKTRD